MSHWSRIVFVLSLACSGPALAQGGLLDQGRNLLQMPGAATPKAATTDAQATSGLREALNVAARKTVGRVGRNDGYNGDKDIRIPLPGYLNTARQGLGAVGMAGVLDDLQLRMNRAAEDAAPKATDIFADSIARMSVTDAKGIVSGPKDAATRYFQRTTTEPLKQAFRPIIDRALASAGAVQAFKDTSARLAPAAGGLGGLLGGGAAGGGVAGFDLTDFVLEKALEGLFHYIAVEEEAIRSNPAARTTELLREVFGG
jgi:Protein of unknown function (DUF4197)